MTFEQYIDRFNIRLDDQQAEAVKCDNLCLLRVTKLNRGLSKNSKLN